MGWICQSWHLMICLRVFQEIYQSWNSNILKSNCSISQILFFWFQKCMVVGILLQKHEAWESSLLFAIVWNSKMLNFNWNSKRLNFIWNSKMLNFNWNSIMLNSKYYCSSGSRNAQLLCTIPIYNRSESLPRYLSTVE